MPLRSGRFRSILRAQSAQWMGQALCKSRFWSGRLNEKCYQPMPEHPAVCRGQMHMKAGPPGPLASEGTCTATLACKGLYALRAGELTPMLIPVSLAQRTGQQLLMPGRSCIPRRTPPRRAGWWRVASTAYRMRRPRHVSCTNQESKGVPCPVPGASPNNKGEHTPQPECSTPTTYVANPPLVCDHIVQGSTTGDTTRFNM